MELAVGYWLIVIGFLKIVAFMKFVAVGAWCLELGVLTPCSMRFTPCD